jgi:L-alanine-DL-glutamate epimerase-like enolase superfamily enzyme
MKLIEKEHYSVSNRRTKDVSRRKLLRQTAGLAAAGSLFKFTEPASAQSRRTMPLNKNSAPSQLKITDIRACTVAANYDYPLIRIDTNQGVYGLGEVFAAGFKGSALMLKPFIVGRNPLQISEILRRLRNSAGQGFWHSGYGAIDFALHDIAGKVYGVPAWRLLGDKIRDRIRIYCDTHGSVDPKIYAQKVLRRKEAGFTMIKMDLYTSLLRNRKGAIDSASRAATDEGLKYMCEYVHAARDLVGKEFPLAADHFGRLSLKDCIRYARAFEPLNLAWAEDFIPDPWLNWKDYKILRNATTTPILTGEQSFGLREGFQDLIDNEAADIIHPDYVASGGMREIKLIADYAAAHGIPTVIHQPGSPIGQIGSAHIAATLSNFIACEHHAADMPWWQDLVTGCEKPIINNGYVAVPDTPGLGVELNEAVIKEHLRYPGYFEPTPEFDNYITTPWMAAPGPWPHLDENGKLVNTRDEN